MSINQLRHDPITGNWTIVVQDGQDVDFFRPLQSRRASAESDNDSCEFCAGHELETTSEIYALRPGGGHKNGPGWRVRVIPERYPVLQIHGELNNRGVGIYDIIDGIGAHELVIETPEHRRRLVDLDEQHIVDVLTAYRERTLDLKLDERFRYILIHQSPGEGSGATMHHAHGHIIATPITPLRVKEELQNAQAHYQYKERCLFCDVARQEMDDRQRMVADNEAFVAFCPFASRAAFEVWIMPKRHETFFEHNHQLPALAQIVRSVLMRLRVVLSDPNYVLAVHSGPNLLAGKQRGYWKTLERDFHWHIEIMPRLRGIASFEVGSGFQVIWISPERAAVHLREAKI
jgi:UDPglucose--hexose-1-phosphate uridylyltransferase